MEEQLANIVRECLPEKYNPPEALENLFSHTYIPKQDHEENLLMVLQDGYDYHQRRTFDFLDSLQEGRENDDAPFEKVLLWTLKKLEYANFSDMVKKYEKYKEERLVRNVDEWKRDLFSQFTGVSPNSLIALWAIQHEVALSGTEKNYLLESIDSWPMIDKSDSRCAAIYAKFSAIAEEKFGQFGSREERRVAAHNSHKFLGQYELALHDLDHQFLTHWDTWLNPKYG